jgi:imidazoleglycerol phosphate dehydratase HisB
MNRTANVTRKTAETNIRVAINLDGTGQTKLARASVFWTTCWTRSPATD